MTDVGMAEEPASCPLLPLLPKDALAGHTLIARFRHDLDTRTLQVKPLSIITPDTVIRLTLWTQTPRTTMSIAVLTQVYDEARRLAVAGSVVAGGDFRLKKLIPPLEQAGREGPGVRPGRRVREGGRRGCGSGVRRQPPRTDRAGLGGPLHPGRDRRAGVAGADRDGGHGRADDPDQRARLLKPLLEALTNTGSGRLEIVEEAHQRGAFRDLRLVKPAASTGSTTRTATSPSSSPTRCCRCTAARSFPSCGRSSTRRAPGSTRGGCD